MVHECLAAADELAKAGKKATVIDAYSLPLKTDEVLAIRPEKTAAGLSRWRTTTRVAWTPNSPRPSPKPARP